MTFLNVEVLIEGPEEVLDGIERETGLRRAPHLSDFSLERLVPFPRDKVASRTAQAGLAERIRDEVLTPWRQILTDQQVSEESRKWMELELSYIVIRACEGATRLNTPARSSEDFTWREQNWGCTWDVASRMAQRPLGEEDRERIHVSLQFEAESSSAPLLAFDALAARWPAVEMTLAWDGGDKDYLPSSSGITTWRHGMRDTSIACPDRDGSERYGRLHSLLPLRIARLIRDSNLPTTNCRPTLRIDLTKDEYLELEDGGSVVLEVGPEHTITVGNGTYDEFMTLPYRLGGFDYCDARGIQYDEVWRRIPGRILGMKVALTLHSADAVDRNRAETILTQGSDPILDWVRDSGLI